MHMSEQQQRFAVYPWRREEQRQQHQQQQQRRQIKTHLGPMPDNDLKTFGLSTFLQYPLRRQHNPLFTTTIKTESMQKTLASSNPITTTTTTTMRNVKRDMDAATAVVVNSLIYAKPSFCSIVMAVGSSSITSGCFKQHLCQQPKQQQQQQQQQQHQEHPKDIGKNGNPAYSFEKSSSSPVNPPFGCGYGGNLSYLLNGLKISDPGSLFGKDKEKKKDNDAELYMMCTTLNGSINHHISEFCENLLATMLLLDHRDDEGGDNRNSSKEGITKTQDRMNCKVDKEENINGDEQIEKSSEEEEDEEEETELETESESSSESESDSETETEDDDERKAEDGVEMVDTSDSDSLIEFSYKDEGDNLEDDIWSQISDESSDEEDDTDDDERKEKENINDNCTYTDPANTNNKNTISSGLDFMKSSLPTKTVTIEHQMGFFIGESENPIKFEYCTTTSFTRKEEEHVDEVDCIRRSSTTTCFYKKQSYNCDKKSQHRTVHFNMKPVIHVMYTWNYAYRAARKGHWETFVRDRERFRKRIDRTAVSLEPILMKEHRQRIFETRFNHSLSPREDEKEKSSDKHQQQEQKKANCCKESTSKSQPKRRNDRVAIKQNGTRAGPKLRCHNRKEQNGSSDEQHHHQQQQQQSGMKNCSRVRHRKMALIYYCNAF